MKFHLLRGDSSEKTNVLWFILQSAPPAFCPKGRSNDIDAILDVMDKAQKFIYIEVMEYLPTTYYGNPQE